MKALERSAGTTAKINGHLLGAALQGGIATVAWPASYEGWGFAVMSLLMGAGALIALVNALKLMMQLHVRDRTLKSFRAQAKPQKKAALASTSALKKAGVIDG